MKDISEATCGAIRAYRVEGAAMQTPKMSVVKLIGDF